MTGSVSEFIQQAFGYKHDAEVELFHKTWPVILNNWKCIVGRNHWTLLPRHRRLHHPPPHVAEFGWRRSPLLANRLSEWYSWTASSYTAFEKGIHYNFFFAKTDFHGIFGLVFQQGEHYESKAEPLKIGHLHPNKSGNEKSSAIIYFAVIFPGLIDLRPERQLWKWSRIGRQFPLPEISPSLL